MIKKRGLPFFSVKFPRCRRPAPGDIPAPAAANRGWAWSCTCVPDSRSLRGCQSRPHWWACPFHPSCWWNKCTSPALYHTARMRGGWTHPRRSVSREYFAVGSAPKQIQFVINPASQIDSSNTAPLRERIFGISPLPFSFRKRFFVSRLPPYPWELFTAIRCSLA